jgi:hypothetical protein
MELRARRAKGRGPALAEMCQKERKRATERVAANPDYKRVAKLLSAQAIAKGLPATKPIFLAMAMKLAAHLGEKLDRATVRRKDEAICYICEHPEWKHYDLTADIELKPIPGVWDPGPGSFIDDSDIKWF